MIRKIVGLIFCLILVSCSLSGTDTGNPGYNCGEYTCTSMSDESDTVGKVIAIESMTYNICVLLNDCKSQTVDSCHSSLRSQTNFTTKVGLDPADYASVREIGDAEQIGLLIHDAGRLDVCLADIRALSCADSKVDNAYDAADLTNPYRQAAEVLPATCSDVFSPGPSDTNN